MSLYVLVWAHDRIIAEDTEHLGSCPYDQVGSTSDLIAEHINIKLSYLYIEV